MNHTPPTAGEIADLTAWLRKITARPGDTPQTEVKEFLAAKRDLLARIQASRPSAPDQETQP